MLVFIGNIILRDIFFAFGGHNLAQACQKTIFKKAINRLPIEIKEYFLIKNLRLRRLVLILVLFLKDQPFVWPAIDHSYPASGANFLDYAPDI